MNKQKRYMLKNNIQAVLQDDIAVIIGALTFGGLLYLGMKYIDIDQMYGNLGIIITYSQVITHIILALCFGLFVSATLYKIRWMQQFDNTKTTSGILSGFVSTIIIGCPACSIGIASYLGLGSILVSLPRFGLEIKIIGLFILIRATRTTLRDLYTCKKLN